MRRVVFGARARRDFDEIWSYVARDSIDAAEKVVDRVERAVGQLGLMPGMGHDRPELRGRRYRVWPVYSYLIVYGPKTVPIVRVIHGARDLRRLFKRQ